MDQVGKAPKIPYVLDVLGTGADHTTHLDGYIALELGAGQYDLRLTPLCLELSLLFWFRLWIRTVTHTFM